MTDQVPEQPLVNEVREELQKVIETNGEGKTPHELVDLATRVGAVATLFATAIQSIYNLWGGREEFLKLVKERQAFLKDAEAKAHTEGPLDGTE